jgi:hypothetical protein
MAFNDKEILNSILEKKKEELSTDISDSDYFELFVMEQFLKNYELSDDDIEEADVGGGGDGQIDGFVTLINGELLLEDTPIKNFNRSPKFEIYIFQAKTSDSFQETIVERVTATIRNIFNLTKTADTFGLYNPQLVGKVELFKKYYRELTLKHPKLFVSFVYATKGDVESINPNVHAQGDLLKKVIREELFNGSETEVKFLGARELNELYHKTKAYTLEIQFHENAISTRAISTGANGYIILSTLFEYYKFIIGKEGELLKHIFEANVRDYQGKDLKVNKDISATLNSKVGKYDFWWLNNGITILSSNAAIHGKAVTMDNVQVVNGLQTTMELYNYFKEKGGRSDQEDTERSLLIRIVVTEDPEVRDRIIKATNFQTKIPSPQLRATEKIQRDIESYFLSQEWYYDRRKNYYKNIGKPSARIIDIPLLSQTLMAVLQKKPYEARSRPTAIITKDDYYKQIFNDKIPLKLYLVASQLIKKMEIYVRSGKSRYPKAEKTNFKFHALMVMLMLLTKNKDYSIENLMHIDFNQISSDFYENSFNMTLDLAHALSNEKGWDLNRTSKNPEFNKYLIEQITI